MNFYKRAFTLAELCVTLVIIGIIALLVYNIALNSKPNEKLLKFKKADTTLLNTISSLANDSEFYLSGNLSKKNNGTYISATGANLSYFCETIAEKLNTKNVSCATSQSSIALYHNINNNDKVTFVERFLMPSAYAYFSSDDTEGCKELHEAETKDSSGNTQYWCGSCKSGYYQPVAEGKCYKCKSPCETCSSETTCTSCESDYTLYGSICCPKTCSACSSLTVCSACNFGYVLKNSMCVRDDVIIEKTDEDSTGGYISIQSDSDDTNAKYTITDAKTKIDEYCKSYGSAEITLSDNVVFYQTNPAMTLGLEVFRHASPTGELNVYKVTCIDVDGIKKGEDPFGYAIRIDGKVIRGARAEEWLEKEVYTKK